MSPFDDNTLSHVYDRNGVPITSMKRFGELLCDMNYKIVKHTRYPESDVLVSTVWLGTDHNFMDREHTPIIFETMIFGLKQEYQKRYATEQEARDGHEKALAHLPKRVRRETPEEFEGVVPLTGGWL